MVACASGFGPVAFPFPMSIVRPSVFVAGIFAVVALVARADADEAEFAPVVFFPPPPPVYGTPIEDRPLSSARFWRGRRVTAPDGLAEFVAEDFYPALSTRLYALELDPGVETRLRDYRARRQQLLGALLDQFVVVHAAAPAEREKAWRALAEQQSTALAALEVELEALTQDVIRRRGTRNVDWNAARRWTVASLTARNDWTLKEAEFQVLRATAFYAPGLLPAQRGMLRELAMELQPLARRARGLPVPGSDSDAIFFSPETTRLRLPAGASATLREAFAAYNARKFALKAELRDVVLAVDGRPLAAQAEAFGALADRQWPQFAELERLADDVRVELAPVLDASSPPAPPWIPSDLMASIHRYNEERDSYFGEMKHQAHVAAARVPRPTPSSSADEREQQQRLVAERQGQARHEAALEFQRAHRERFSSLKTQFNHIREALALIAARQTDPKTGQPLDADTLLRRHTTSMAEFDAYGRESAIYANYRRAMLEPGLSPEQRRLLFRSAHVGLAQPLPPGELLPTRASKIPHPPW